MASNGTEATVPDVQRTETHDAMELEMQKTKPSIGAAGKEGATVSVGVKNEESHAAAASAQRSAGLYKVFGRRGPAIWLLYLSIGLVTYASSESHSLSTRLQLFSHIICARQVLQAVRLAASWCSPPARLANTHCYPPSTRYVRSSD